MGMGRVKGDRMGEWVKVGGGGGERGGDRRMGRRRRRRRRRRRKRERYEKSQGFEMYEKMFPR